MTSTSVIEFVQDQEQEPLDSHLLMKATASHHSSCSSSSSNSSNSTAVERKRDNPAACIFVASLNKDIEDDELQQAVYAHFQRWGDLLGVKVFKDWLGRPYAFVQYESVSDSRVALKEAPGTILNGRSVRCEPARVNRSICLVSLSQPFNKKYIQESLVEFGEIEDVSVLQPHGKFYSVFIKYKYRDDAIKAFLTLKYADHLSFQLVTAANEEQQWFVEWASNLDASNLHGFYGGVAAAHDAYGSVYSRLDKSSIFIGNLPDNLTEEQLRTKFEQYGSIKRIHIIRKPSYHSREQMRCSNSNNNGSQNRSDYSRKYTNSVETSSNKVFAFIKYRNEQQASNAIDQENGNLYRERILRVCYRQFYPSNNNRYLYQQSQTTNRHPNMIPYYPPQQHPQQTQHTASSAAVDGSVAPALGAVYQVTGIGYYDMSMFQNKQQRHQQVTSAEEEEYPFPAPYMFYPFTNHGAYTYEPYIMTASSPAMTTTADNYTDGYSAMNSQKVTSPTTENLQDYYHRADFNGQGFSFPSVMECSPLPPYTTHNEHFNDSANYGNKDQYYTNSFSSIPAPPTINSGRPYYGYNGTAVIASSASPYYSHPHCNSSAADSYLEPHPTVIYYAYTSPPPSTAYPYQRHRQQQYRNSSTHKTHYSNSHTSAYQHKKGDEKSSSTTSTIPKSGATGGSSGDKSTDAASTTTNTPTSTSNPINLKKEND
ncbi:hypothetical protein BDF20DRAFT_997187 [Mycotypha africana]|uniref:uncharacterized protein n=1 Tax=Mycotypha africana TaxID=64632 RepID=UPI002300A745|nr:uncharacterized protein BDF20DRAFT_997187 [Mycotypha africana]KAI8991272.1 hypothetical protein BDF20DRAFT_997187 [Mycotypha africana]